MKYAFHRLYHGPIVSYVFYEMLIEVYGNTSCISWPISLWLPGYIAVSFCQQAPNYIGHFTYCKFGWKRILNCTETWMQNAIRMLYTNVVWHFCIKVCLLNTYKLNNRNMMQMRSKIKSKFYVCHVHRDPNISNNNVGWHRFWSISRFAGTRKLQR